MKLSEASDGFVLVTEHLYSPPLVTLSRCWYLTVTGSFNTVSVPSVTSSLSPVHWTVVAGPPVEIQVRVNWGLAPPNVNDSIETSPAEWFTHIKNNHKFHKLPFPVLYSPT